MKCFQTVNRNYIYIYIYSSFFCLQIYIYVSMNWHVLFIKKSRGGTVCTTLDTIVSSITLIHVVKVVIGSKIVASDDRKKSY